MPARKMTKMELRTAMAAARKDVSSLTKARSMHERSIVRLNKEIIKSQAKLAKLAGITPA